MRALSLTQPWAWLVVHGGKDVENRRWNTHFGGEFLVHAAKGMTKDDYDAAWEMARTIDQNLAWAIPLREKLDRGGIVGRADLYGVLPRTANPSTPWHMRNQYGFCLRNQQPLPFLACRGALGFWGNFELRDGKAVQL